VGAPLPLRGRGRVARPRLRPPTRPQHHATRSGRGDRRPAATADDRTRGRRGPGDAHLDGLGRTADRPGQALAPGSAGAGPPLRALPPRRADPRRREEARPDRRRAGHQILGREGRSRNPTRRDGSGVRRARVGWECVHVCVDDRHLPRLRRGPPRREDDHRDSASCAGPWPSIAPRDRGGAADDRQRPRLRLGRTCPRLQGDGHPPPPHPLRPYRPQTNGKAERFIRTMVRDWAYAGVYGSSPERAAAALAGSGATTSAEDMAPPATGRRSSGYGNWPGTTWPASKTRRSRAAVTLPAKVLDVAGAEPRSSERPGRRRASGARVVLSLPSTGRPAIVRPPTSEGGQTGGESGQDARMNQCLLFPFFDFLALPHLTEIFCMKSFVLPF
jgi:hypothetical protein